MKPVTDLDLPLVSRSVLSAENTAVRARQPFHGDFDGQAIRIHPVQLSEALEAAEHWTALDLSINREQAELYTSIGFVDRAVASVDPDLTIDDLDPETAGMVMELAFKPFLTILEQQAGLSVATQGLRPAPPPLREDIFGFMVHCEGLPETPVLLSAPPPLARQVKRWIELLPPEPTPVDALPVSISFRVGYAVLTLDELIAIRSGDGIVLDATTVPEKRVIAVTGEAYAQTCVLTSNGLELEGPLLNPPRGYLKGWTFMANNDIPSPGETSLEPGAVGQINVRLVFEVGRLDVTVDDLQKIGSGHVFDLGRPVGQAVEIIASGRQIGAGELVRVGDQIGVRVDWILK